MLQYFAGYAGLTKSARGEETCQDYILFTELDEDTLIAIIADGSGRRDAPYQAAAVIAHRIVSILRRFYFKDKDLFVANMKLMAEQAILASNDILTGFKMGNEELYGAHGTCLSVVILRSNGTLAFGHAGNTRIYLMRAKDAYEKPIQLTKDQTVGWRLVEEGSMSESDYYTSPERLEIYNALGIIPNPSVQTFQLKVSRNDVLLMTTDGIHYSYKPDAFPIILMDPANQDLDGIAQSMIKLAEDQRNNDDDKSACVIWFMGAGEEMTKEEKA